MAVISRSMSREKKKKLDYWNQTPWSDSNYVDRNEDLILGKRANYNAQAANTPGCIIGTCIWVHAC